MNGVREWASVICLSALSAAMLQGLVPSGSMERMAKFVIGAFIILAMVSPISKVVPQIRTGPQTRNDTAEENKELKSTVENQYEDAARQSIAGVVHAELKRLGYRCKNVQVIMDTDANNSISINKVIVTVGGDAAGTHTDLAAELEKTLGIQSEVVFDEG